MWNPGRLGKTRSPNGTDAPRLARAGRTRKAVPLQKTIPLQKNAHTAPALMPTGNIEKRDSIRIKVLNEGGWEIGKRETR